MSDIGDHPADMFHAPGPGAGLGKVIDFVPLWPAAVLSLAGVMIAAWWLVRKADRHDLRGWGVNGLVACGVGVATVLWMNHPVRDVLAPDVTVLCSRCCLVASALVSLRDLDLSLNGLRAAASAWRFCGAGRSYGSTGFSRPIADGQSSLANVGGKRHLTFAGRAAETGVPRDLPHNDERTATCTLHLAKSANDSSVAPDGSQSTPADARGDEFAARKLPSAHAFYFAASEALAHAVNFR